MKTFNYQLLRFLPDRISGEFLNLGIVVFDRNEKKLSVKISEKLGRFSHIFPSTNTRYLMKVLKHIDDQLKTISCQLSNELSLEHYVSIDQITRKVLPKDDSALFFTEELKIMDLDISAASDYLFDRLVSIHQTESEKEYRSDKEVWSKIYKNYFDKINISKHLAPLKIQTKFNTVTFEHAWKNGYPNFFETVNFDLEKNESIRNKVFRWAGQIDELKTSNEKSHLYLLSILPKDDNETVNFITQFLKSKSSAKVKVDLVTLENVSEVAKSLKEEMEKHMES